MQFFVVKCFIVKIFPKKAFMSADLKEFLLIKHLIIESNLDYRTTSRYI